MDDNEYAPENDHRPHLSLERHLAVGPHVYQLTASGTGDERIGLTLVGWNASGEVVSEISGGISPADLAPVADALTSTLAGLATLRRQRFTAVPPAAIPTPISAAVPGAIPAVGPGANPGVSPGTLPAVGPGAIPGVVPGAAQPVKRHRNQGLRWSAEDDDRLAERHRAGASPKELMAEFGRSRGGITARLEHLGLITPDGGAAPPGEQAA